VEGGSTPNPWCVGDVSMRAPCQSHRALAANALAHIPPSLIASENGLTYNDGAMKMDLASNG
jgi:hypothetical protein